MCEEEFWDAGHEKQDDLALGPWQMRNRFAARMQTKAGDQEVGKVRRLDDTADLLDRKPGADYVTGP